MDKNTVARKESFRLGISFCGMFMFMFVVSIVLNAAYYKTGFQSSFISSTLLLEVALIVIGYIYIKTAGLNIAEGIGLRKVHYGTILKAFAIGLLVIPVASFVNVLSQIFVPNTMAQASGEIIESGVMATMIISSLVGPMCEEFAFRGVLHTGYRRIAGPLCAAVISSLMFGVQHMNLNQLGYAFVLGLIFCAVNEASGSIITSFIVHFTVNFINMAMLIIANSAAEMTDMSLAESAEAARADSSSMITMAVVYAILGTIAIAIMIPVIRSIAKKEGNYDSYRSILSKKYREKLSAVAEEVVQEDDSVGTVNAAEATASEETSETKTGWKVVLSIPAIATLVFGLIIIIVEAVNAGWLDSIVAMIAG